MQSKYFHLTQDAWQKLMPSFDGEVSGIDYLVQDIVFNYNKYDSDKKKYYKFLKQESKKSPFIIGITGSVAAGKSTFSKKLLEALKRMDYKVDLVSTDGFLMSNAELNEKNIMYQKGFPISFNWQAQGIFLQNIKLGENNIPYRIYSQEISDLVPDRVAYVKKPDILIIEGINILQIPLGQNAVPSDYLDYSIYLDSSESNLSYWFMERFHKLLELNKNNPKNFYYKWANVSRDQADRMAIGVWNDVNLKNLHDNIAPIKERADVIVKKEKNHVISDLYLRKY